MDEYEVEVEVPSMDVVGWQVSHGYMSGTTCQDEQVTIPVVYLELVVDVDGIDVPMQFCLEDHQVEPLITHLALMSSHIVRGCEGD